MGIVSGRVRRSILIATAFTNASATAGSGDSRYVVEHGGNPIVVSVASACAALLVPLRMRALTTLTDNSWGTRTTVQRTTARRARSL